MTNHTDEFFLGIMVLKEGKWSPHSKFSITSFGSALSSAEGLDKANDFEAVKLMKIPTKGKGEQKEMWVSPSIKARANAQNASKFRAGVRKTQDNFADAHAKRKEQ